MAHAEMSNAPIANYPQTNGQVNSVIAAPDGSTYITGDFTSINSELAQTYTIPNGTTVNTATSIPASIPAIPDEGVDTSISDNNGGWYIAGEFENVGGIPRKYIAHILSDGTLDTNFAVDLDYSPQALAFDDAANILYVGGGFTTVDGNVARNGLAAFDSTTGAVTDFDPNLESLANESAGSASRLTLSSDGQFLYATGSFDQVNGITPLNNMAVFDTATGIATSFDAGLSTWANVRAIALSPDDSTVYISGAFDSVNNGAAMRSVMAGLDATTGIATSFDPNLNDYAYSIAVSPDGQTVYAGGGFSNVNGGTVRRGLAAFGATDGTVTGFDAELDGNYVFSIALTSDGQTLYASGNFTNVNGSTARINAAAFDTDTSVATSFNPAPNQSAGTLSLNTDASTIYMGGYFAYFGGQPTGGVTREGIAHILSDGTLDPNFNPTLDGGAGSALALSPDGSTLYVGGEFDSVNGGTARLGLAAFSTADGTVTDFDAGFTDGVAYRLALSSDGLALYVAGSFQTVNGGTPRNGLAAFSTASGVVGAFDAELDGSVESLILSSNDQTLYIGGYFTTVNGSTPRNGLAALDTTTSVATIFDPNVNNSVRSLALSSDGQLLYLAGGFTSVNGTTRRRLAAVSTDTGVINSFNPNVTGGTVNSIALSPDGSTLYAGGGFTRVNGTGSSGTTVKEKLTAFNTTSSTVTGFNPTTFDEGAYSPTVNSIALSPPDGSTLYAGGQFELRNATIHRSLAAFHDPSIPTPGPGPSPDNGGESENSESAGDLANTGMPVHYIVLFAVALLVLGSVGMYASSRRKGTSI
jgi:hypothetical protein